VVDLFYPVLTMNLLLVVGAWCLARPSPPAAACLAALAVTWLFANGTLEGQILWSLTATHGLTVSDLLSVAAVALAVRTWRHHGRHEAPGTSVWKVAARLSRERPPHRADSEAPRAAE